MSQSDTIKMMLIAVAAILLMVSNAFAQTARRYLETIDIKDLCIAYSENRQGFWLASVMDPDGYLHTVIEGSLIGKNNGRIKKITNHTVEVRELIWRQDESTADWVERPLTLQVACPMIPPRANAPSDGSYIRWLGFAKAGKEPTTERRFIIHFGISVGDCRLWRWVYGENNGAVEPATSEEAKELKEHYGGDAIRCPTQR